MTFNARLLGIVTVLFSLLFGYFAWQTNQQKSELSTAFQPTATLFIEVVGDAEVVVTPTATMTKTPRPTRTPTPEPTLPPTPFASPTLQPPIEYVVAPNELILNIALRYDVTLDSIKMLNLGLDINDIAEGQSILVPMPTATPPLAPIEVELPDRAVLADPTDCVMHEIEQDDTMFSISLEYNVPYDALLAMNRLTEQSILRIGGQVCIPTIIEIADSRTNELFLTERESLSAMNFVRILAPFDGQLVTADNSTVLLQWISERPLESDEKYLIEYRIDEGDSTQVLVRTNQIAISVKSGQSVAWDIRYVAVLPSSEDGEQTYQPLGDVNSAAFTVK